MLGYTPEEVLSLHTWDWEANMPEEEVRANFQDLSKTKTTFETRHRSKDGTIYDAEVTACGAKLGSESMVLTITRDITDRKRAEEAFQKRMIALTQPLDHPEGVTFEDLFNIDDIQRLQDQFSKATGVASVITHTDGTPITQPSNFCRPCNVIIRKTDKGLANC